MAATNYTPIQLYFSTTASAVPLAANLAQGELAINITDGKLYYEDNAGVVQVIATKGAGTIGGTTTQIQYNNAGALAGNAAMTFNSGTSTTTLTTLNLTNALGATYGGTAQSAYTQGDVLYASATNTLAKLGIGTVNYILTSTGTVPQWVAPSSITVNTATNLAGGLGGSVPYQSALDTTTFLAIGAANRVMTSTGSAPQWVTSLTGLTGVSSSSITNTSLTSGRVVVSSTAGLQADDADLTFDGTTLSAGGFSTTGLSTLVKTVKIGDSSFSGTAVFAAATPAKLYIGTGTVTDATSAIGATNATGAVASLAITPIAATNTSVTYTNASTLYIAGAPSAGTNITITNPYSLYVNAGAAYFGGAVTVAGSLSLAAVTVTSLSDSGNLTFTGTGNRITGDFTNATIANRTIFQTSTTNAQTGIIAIPNGTGTTAQFEVNSDSTGGTNASVGQLALATTDVRIVSSTRGTGTYLPLTFYTNLSEKLRIGADTTGTITIGGTAPRITGDFSSTPASRVAFQTSTVNGNTNLEVIPNGTSTTSALNLESDPALTNGTFFQLGLNGGTDARLTSAIRGTGTYLPMTFYTGGSEAMRISSTAGSLGSVGIGYSSALTGIGNNGLAVLGYVGIGTTTPTNRLNVVASDSTNIVGASTAGITITNTYTGAYGYSSDLIYGLGGGAGTKLAGISGIYTSGGGVLAFYTYNGTTFAEKMRIDGSGNVGIGTNAISGLSLRISKSLTPGTDSGATDSYGVRVDGNIPSSVTGSARLFSTYPSTSATAFTVSTLAHYTAGQGALGAGSSVTSQNGFYVDASMVGGTNNSGLIVADIGGASATTGKSNIAFYSAVSTASGGGSAWNIYMAGSASNYFAGAVGIGTPTPSSFTNAKLVVAATSSAPANIYLARNGNAQVTQPTTYAANDSGILSFYQGDAAVSFVRYLDVVSDGSAGSASSVVRFWTNSGGGAATEKVRIDGSGNVGISQTSPQAKLQINTAADGAQIIVVGAQTANEQTLLFRNSYYTNNATSGIAAIGWIDSGSSGGSLTFKTGTNGGGVTNIPSERMRIDQAGNVGIGLSTITSFAGASNRTLEIYNSSSANTEIRLVNATTGTGPTSGGLIQQAGNDLYIWNAANSFTAFGTNNVERMRIDSSGNVLVTNPAGLGYGTGSGGTVTQATSKSTAVTLNKPTGQITMNNAALGAGSSVSFNFINSLLAATDSLVIQPNYAVNSQSYTARVTFCGAGGAYINVTNLSGGSLSEAVTLSFAIIKGATS